MMKIMKSKTQIIIQGHLDMKWADWFEESEIAGCGNNTILIIHIKDEAHMHGILNKIRDLNLKLISINPIDKKQINEIINKK
jgi:hypothetical protein